MRRTEPGLIPRVFLSALPRKAGDLQRRRQRRRLSMQLSRISSPGFPALCSIASRRMQAVVGEEPRNEAGLNPEWLPQHMGKIRATSHFFVASLMRPVPTRHVGRESHMISILVIKSQRVVHK